jgi:multidrug efflux pump subunit AcrB
MMKKLVQFTEIVQQDPAVAKVAAFYGSGGSYGSAFAVLKPLAERQASAKEIADRVKPKLEQIAGAALDFALDAHALASGLPRSSVRLTVRHLLRPAFRSVTCR